MRFLESYIGMFITQSVMHALITAIIVEMSFYSWEIKDSLARFRYRLLVLVLPVFMFPAFQIVNAERGSMYFRENNAIFNISRWLSIRMWDIIPVHAIFYIFLALTALIFILQEIFPIIAERLPKFNQKSYLAPDAKTESIIENLCKKISITRPSLLIMDESYPMIFTTGIKNYTITMSKGLLCKLDDDQLEAALAHEFVHILRGSSIKTQVIYILRMLMFYNPVSMMEFRRLVQDDEFVCDDITVSVTKKPDALISALRVFYTYPAVNKASRILTAKDIIESHSHNLLLRERILGIQEKAFAGSSRFGWIKYIITTLVILKINYMVV